MCTQYFHNIHPPMPFPHILHPPTLVPAPWRIFSTFVFLINFAWYSFSRYFNVHLCF
jgi:hypothetical protein